MRKAEIIMVSLALVAFVLKLMSIGGGAFLATVFFCVLTMMYLLAGWMLFNRIRLRDVFKRESYKDAGSRRILWALVVSGALMIGIISLLFGLNGWAGAVMLMKCGMLFLLPVGVTSLVRYLNRPSFFHRGIWIRCGVLMLLIVGLLLLHPVLFHVPLT